MARVLKRPQAESDLDEIWWYIAQDNPDNADLFLDASRPDPRMPWGLDIALIAPPPPGAYCFYI